MVESARRQVSLGEDVSGDGASAEVLGRYLRGYARQIAEEPEAPLFFGRLDFDTAPTTGDHRGQRYYIGRRHIAADATATPMVIDWRAPVSRVFYQASPPRDPQGVAVRRRFGWAPASRGEPGDLTSLEDERLGAATAAADRGDEAATAGGGSWIVAAEIERPRVGPMRDIVATIQPEQDDLVRRALADSVPGTGKTAVGLHRAAYLLYTYPQRIQRGGLLVVGPNRTFLRYIAEVLPALGEIDVRQCTDQDLVDRFPVRGEDPPETAAVKHDPRGRGPRARPLPARAPSERVPGHPRRHLPLAGGRRRTRRDRRPGTGAGAAVRHGPRLGALADRGTRPPPGRAARGPAAPGVGAPHEPLPRRQGVPGRRLARGAARGRSSPNC